MLSLGVAFVFVLLFVCFFSPFIIVITLLGEERELVYVLLVYLFVSFVSCGTC